MKTETIHIFKRALRLLSALPLVGALALTACTDNGERDTTPINPSDNDVMITVTIPRAQVPTTRSIAEDKGEAAVNNIDILVFKSVASGSDVLLQHVRGTIIEKSTDKDDEYKVTFLARLASDPSATSIVVLANLSDININSIKNLTNKVDILEMLTCSATEKWKTDADNYTHIPMYGESSLDKGVKAGMIITGIELIRMLARIDVVNNAGTHFKLINIYVANYNTGGYVAPKWDSDGNVNEPPYSTPNVPITSISLPQTGFDNAIQYKYNVINNGAGMYGEIYTFEALANTNDANHEYGICLILEAEYNDNTYFYRVDFTAGKDEDDEPLYDDNDLLNPKFNPLKVSYIPLLRNHKYTVKITDAYGIGYSTAKEAVKSLGVLSNLKTELLVQDESGITSTVFNGQYYLGIASEEVELGVSAGSTASIKCTTNYFNGWELDESKGSKGIVFVPENDVWLSAEKDPDGNAQTANLLLSASSTATAERVATVYLKAGRLRHELKVTQVYGSIDIEGILSCYEVDGSRYSFTVNSVGAWRINSITPRYENGSEPLYVWKSTDNMRNNYIGGSNSASTTTVNFTTANQLSGQVAYLDVEFVSADNPARFEPKLATLLLSGEYYPKPHQGWAGSNIYWDGTKLTFEATNESNPKQRYQGVFFQWGSLYGLTPIETDWTSESMMYFPDGVSLKANTLYSSWDSWPRVSDKTSIKSYLPNSLNKYERDRAYLYELNSQNVAGIGDICKHLTDMEWAPAGKWRMPTSNEFETEDSYEYTTMSLVLSGESAIVIENGWKKKDTGNPFFNLGGYRFYNSSTLPVTGKLNQVGSAGMYWASSPNASAAYFLYLNVNKAYPESPGGHRGNAFPIRCVKEKN